MVETQISPPLLPQVSIDPVTLGAGEPAVTGVPDGEESTDEIDVSLEADAWVEPGTTEGCMAPVA